MKDFHLRFCIAECGWFTGMIEDLIGIADPEIPKTAGAYILGTSNNVMLTYPWGSSPIFYIGKAKNLKKRALEHKRHIEAATHDHDEIYWWPRYQYGAAFGTTFAWYSRHGPQEAQNIESSLIEEFYKVFGAIPAANSYWPRKIKPTRGTRG